MSNEITHLQPVSKREIQSVVDPVPIMDTARFEHFQRIASVMARSSMIPETLRTEGKKNDKKPLPYEQVLSNCFLVVNQAARWGMDPFAVISCCSVVHGRLAYEGKLVAAVLDAKLGISLHHHFTGEPASEAYRIYLSDQPFTDAVIQQLKPGVKIPGLRLWDGSVAEWKTTGEGTPWTPKNFPRMLIYRGSRDWTRIYEPAVLLGVYTDDELMDLAEDARARRATPVASLADRLSAARGVAAPAPAGFSIDHVENETSTQEYPEGASGTAREAPSAGSGDADLQSESGTQSAPPTNPAQPPSESAPAAANNAPPALAAAGNLSPSDLAPTDGPAGEDGAGIASPSSPLPQGWEIQLCAALRRARKRESVVGYAKQFFEKLGAVPTDQRDIDSAKAIRTVFEKHFGDTAAIDDALREIV